MIIGHLPAGYVICRLLFPRVESWGVARTQWFWAGMLGAVAPDLDLLYFYLVDGGQHYHHTYISHFPVLWVGLLLISATWLYASRFKWNAALAVIFSLNGFIHMVLDSIVGGIWWFAPWVEQRSSFCSVEALYQPWWSNLILHWSLALEIGLVVWAVYLRSRDTQALHFTREAHRLHWSGVRYRGR